ncbi:MAG: hypothetical protein ACK41D_02345 [Rubricoccaceae bacterium]
MAGKGFRFALDPALTVRRDAAERAERVLGEAIAARQQAADALVVAEDALRDVALCAAEKASPEAFRRRATALHAAMQTRARARAALEAAARREAQARAALLAAHRDADAIGTLRDQAASAHRAARLRAADAAADELATAAYARRLLR